MPTIEIRNRWTNDVVFSGEYPDLRAAVAAAISSRADLRDSDLRGSDLRDSDLRGSNLCGSDLSGSDLRGSDLRDSDLRDSDLRGAMRRDGIVLRLRPLQLFGLDYPVIIFDSHMEIGCQIHSLAEWRAFDNDAIARMDGRHARKFWDAHGPALLALAASDGRGVEAEKPADVNV